MDKVLDIRGHVENIHQANLQASLAHRLAVARANNDGRLIELLEREQEQLQPTIANRSNTSHNHQPTQSWLTWLSHAWQRLVDEVIRSSELQVWQRIDQAGICWWHAYDPLTGRSVYTSSESEMRFWIEENYHGR